MVEVNEEFHEALRQGGYRMTPQRQLVLQAVGELGHATPDAIAAEVQSRVAGVNLSTIYRTLDLLEELGLITHTHLGHGSPTYHVAEDSQHLHLVCQRCGAVQHVESGVAAPLSAALDEQFGFAADVHHFAVYGVCTSCRQSAEHPGLAAGSTDMPGDAI